MCIFGRQRRSCQSNYNWRGKSFDYFKERNINPKDIIREYGFTGVINTDNRLLLINKGENDKEKTELNINNEIKIITSKKEEERNISIKDTKLYIPPPPLLPTYIPPPPAPPASWANLNFFNMRLDSKGIPLPPPFPNFNNLFKNEDSSSIRNKLGIIISFLMLLLIIYQLIIMIINRLH